MEGELELGQTDDPRSLVLGDPATLTSTAEHLAAFADSFGRTAQGLRGIDVGTWTGTAADAFHATFHATPDGWIAAADAFGRATTAIDRFRQTVDWAQDQARRAAGLFAEGRAASERARAAYDQQVDAYDAGTTAPMPAPFVDPGAAAMQQARQILADARSDRDGAAAEAARELAAASGLAPPVPSGWDRMAAQFGDAIGSELTQVGHALTGVAESTEGALTFARAVNPADPYNTTHPAAYLSNLSDTAAGLVHTAAHPFELVKDLVGTGYGSDPARAVGRSASNVLLAVATDGGSRGAVAATGRDAVASTERAAAHTPTSTTRPPVETVQNRVQPGLDAADARVAERIGQSERALGSIDDLLNGLTVRDRTPGSPAPASAPMPLVQPTAEAYAASLTSVESRLRELAPRPSPAVDFADDIEAARYGAENWNSVVENLPAHQKAALRDYTMEPPHYPTYVQFNGALRGLIDMTDELRAGISDIDDAMAVHPTPQDVMVARGTDLRHLPGDATQLVGKTIHENGYLSTSLGSAAFKHKEAIVHLLVPEGTPALYLEKASIFDNLERELLLARDLDWTAERVARVDGRWQIYGRIIPS